MQETTFLPQILVSIYFPTVSQQYQLLPLRTENYHNSTIRAIRENLMDLSPKVQNIRLVYCPAHQSIQENELANSLAKTASKKAKHLQPNTQLSPSEIKQGNKMLSISK